MLVMFRFCTIFVILKHWRNISIFIEILRYFATLKYDNLLDCHADFVKSARNDGSGIIAYNDEICRLLCNLSLTKKPSHSHSC